MAIRWHLELIEGPDFTKDSQLLEFVRDEHLRAANGTDENLWIEQAWKATYRAAERTTRLALIPQTWSQVMDRFPYGADPIVIQKAPLLSVTSIDYIDPDGAVVTLAGSPAEFEVRAPSGPKATRGEVYPFYNTTWPETRVTPEAVTVTFTCGYALTGDPETASVPEDITHGRLLMLGELYKQRSLSVHALNQNPALIQARDIWLEYRRW